MTSMRKLCLAILLAGAVPCANVLAAESIEPKEFVEKASAKGLAEIETSKMALKKGTSQEVKTFAQTMIDDHTKANQELKTLAKNKKLDTANDKTLMDQAKGQVLKLRDGESFDEAYANNQVAAHEQTIELFRQASTIKDPELKAFADKTLPKLEHHLQMAQALKSSTEQKKDRQSKRTENDGRTGIEPGSAGAGMAAGSSTGSGTGSGSEAGGGTSTRSGSDASGATSTRSGSNTGSGTGTGTRSGSGSDMSTGTGTGTGTGTRSGTDAGSATGATSSRSGSSSSSSSSSGGRSTSR